MRATNKILDKLEGHYGYLSVQKCCSNVVEKCLQFSHESKRVKIIHELSNDPTLINILLHKYGNYVIQTALNECEVITVPLLYDNNSLRISWIISLKMYVMHVQNAAVRDALIRAIRTHVAALRNNTYGKRILSKIHLNNREH